MKRAIIQPDKCVNCLECKVQAFCEFHAVIRESSNDKPWIDFYRCSGCIKCKIICPESAIEELIGPCSENRKYGW